ncbi:MAG: AMP-binding protein [Actinomycetota bacterium]
MGDRGVGSWIERRARNAPDHPALIHGDARRSYAQLAERIRRLSHALRGMGVQRGDRVGWLGANHPAFLEVLFASAKLGAVLSPVNHRLNASVIRDLLQDFSPTVVVVEGSAEDVLPDGMMHRRVLVDGGHGNGDYESLIADAPEAPIDEPIGFEDLCLLPHTSGTTGAPKGIMLTHGNITWNVVNFLSIADFRSDDVTIAIAPFFRTGGIGVNVLPVLFKGGTVVVPQAVGSEETLRLIEDHRVSVGFGNPDLLDALTRSPRWPHVDLSSVRFFMTGGAPVPERLIHVYMERGITFLQGYGLSEAAPLVLLLDPGNALRKVGSAGKPPLLVDVRTVRQDGTECAAMETGELLVRGPNVMAGYWNRPDATSRAIDDDGWLSTGDAARIDDEGFVWIIDRVDAAYRSSGRVVYPGVVERVLQQHPAVAAAGVTGRDGAGVAFIIVLDGGPVSEEELLEFCRARLEPHEVPASIHFVEQLPLNSVGKLIRRELARLAESVGEGSTATVAGSEAGSTSASEMTSGSETT